MAKKLDPTTLVDARATLDLTRMFNMRSGTLSLSLWIDNLLDSRYETIGYSYPDPSYTSFYTEFFPGCPAQRILLGNLRVRYLGTLGPIDLTVVAIYLAATVFLGARSARPPDDRTEDFLLAGRRLTLPAFVDDVGRDVVRRRSRRRREQLPARAVELADPGSPLLRRRRLVRDLVREPGSRDGAYTIPDLLFDTYGRMVGTFGTLVVLALSLPAAYLLMLGVILRRATGIGQITAVLASAAFCVAYVAIRGFRSVVQTKGLQFVLMFGGFLILLPAAVARRRRPRMAARSRPRRNRGPRSAAKHRATSSRGTSSRCKRLVEPTFFQRCFAARSPATARRGIFVSIAFFALFDALTTFTGLYARALLPNLPSAVDAYPALAEMLLPAILLGIFYAGMIATVMSTVDSFLFVGAVTIGRDLIWRLRQGRADQTLWTRWGLVAATVLATAIALGSASVVALWYGFGSVGTVVLLPPILGAFFPRLRSSAAASAVGMIASAAVTLAWLTSGWMAADGRSWLGIEPIYPGFATALTIHAVGLISARRPN